MSSESNSRFVFATGGDDGPDALGTGDVDAEPGSFGEAAGDWIEPDVQLGRVLELAFGIGRPEWRAYRVLLTNPNSTTSELAGILDRDRSNVNRALKGLREKGLVTRRRRLLDGGGHVYQYAPRPASSARDAMHAGLEEWADLVHDRIDEVVVADPEAEEIATGGR